ncbi:MAG: hypothetical protein ACLQVI_13970 [Polyangiaceae bacterium]
MGDDRQHDGAGETDRPDPSETLLDRLDGHAVTVERVRAAESHYLEMTAGSSSRGNSRARRAYETEIAKAMDRLAEAVVDLQESHVTIQSLADDEGISAAALRELDESFAAAHREYAGYLGARTYQQVRAAADDRALRERRPR